MKNPHASYLYRTALFVLVTTAVIAGWNAFIDPWSIHHEGTVHGLNHFKSSDRGENDRLVKAWRIRRIKPDALLIGSSRVDWGLREGHPALDHAERPLNAGMAGATMYEVLRMVQHAQQVRPLGAVVVGLDLEMFSQLKHQPTFDETRLRESRWDIWKGWRDQTATLLSLDALEKSRRTIKYSRRNRQWTRQELVTRGSRYFEEHDVEHYRKSYPFALAQVRRNLSDLDRRQKLLIEQLRYFRELLDFAHAEGIRLHMYVHPYHHTALDVIQTKGSAEIFRAWKINLAGIDAKAAKAAGSEPFRILDCSGYHEISREPLPWPSANPGAMEWYHESSHFRVKLGDRILDGLFGRTEVLGKWLSTADAAL